MRSLPPAPRLMVTALVALATLLLSGCRSTCWSPDGKTIALDVDGKLRLLDVATKTFRTIDTGGRYVVNPTYSPDGRLLAYYTISSENERLKAIEFWIRNVATGKAWKLVDDIYSRTHPPEAAERPSLRDAALVTKAYMTVAWSPDGGRVAINRSTDAGISALTVDVATGATVPFPHEEPATGEGLCAWSPDGRRIAYLRWLRDGPKTPGSLEVSGAELWVVSADGKNPVRLCARTEQEQISMGNGPRWSAEGRDVLFTMLRLQSLSPVFAERWTALTRSPPSIDGQVVISTLMACLSQLDVMSVPATGGTPRVVARGVSPFGAMAPDGKAAAYIAGDKLDQLFFRQAPSNPWGAIDRLAAPAVDPQELENASLRGGIIPFPTFSPDGRSVALVVKDGKGQHPELRLYTPATGEKQIIPIE